MSIDLYHGDCLEIMKQLPDKSVDCFICDLPYGCLTGGGITKKETAEKYGRKGTEGISGCAWDIKIPLDKLWEQIKRLCKDDHTPILMFCTTRFGYELIKSNESWFRYDLVWDKQRGVSFLSANKMPMRSHEMIYVFSKAGSHYIRKDISGNFVFSKGGRNEGKSISRQYNTKGVEASDNSGKRCILSVIHKPISTTRGGHPTEKPLELYKFLIERYCPLNGTLLDPTAGSFNSCFAGYELNRNCIGIEKDDTFYKKASERADTL